MENLQLMIYIAECQAKTFERFLDNLEVKGFSKNQIQTILNTYLETTNEMANESLKQIDNQRKSILN